MSRASDDESAFSDEPADLPSVFRQLVGASISDEAVQEISEHFSSLSPSDDGLDLYSKLPPVGDPNRHDKLLDLLFADVAIRRHLGTEMSVHQYLRKYPELKRDEILNAFEAMGNKTGPPVSNIHQSLPPPTANSALRPVGEYKLLKQLGVGGFGEVWLADAPGGVPVAVKIIKRPIDDYTARQEHQALVLVKGLSHPCLVQTQAYWVLDDRLVIAMELCEQNLRQRLKECQAQGLPGVPKKELIGCFRSAAEALDHLHKHKVHHRDIKPENLMLHHGHLKIADFGLAFLYDTEASMMTAPEAGTGRYMAPEVWNRKLSKHSDQYSLALAYAELRLGRPIITGKSTIEFMRQHIEGEPNLDGLPMDEADVVRQALAKNAHDRFESCAAFIEALAETEREETKPKRRWLVPGLVTALIVVLGAYGYSTWNGGPTKVMTVELGPRVPEGAIPVGVAQVQDRNGRPRYKTLAVAREGVRVEFVFVQPARSEPTPFYISARKITNGVMKAAYDDPAFKELLAEWKKRVGPKLESKCFPNEWPKGGIGVGSKDLGSDHADWPALRVTAAEAAVVAEWLGGKLPTPQQWDAAAGIDGGDFGPFKLPFGQVARNRPEGPAPVGSLVADMSKHGVFDVAGNGEEWTRYLFLSASSIHEEPVIAKLVRQDDAGARVYVRGFSYADGKDAELVEKIAKSGEGFGAHPWTEADPLTGFRVVLESP
jgi:formylglycine-generating enzyme required for sulfatase activity